MNSLPKIGKIVFAIPFIIFGAMHLMNAKQMAGMVPIPFAQEIFVYLTGIALVAGGIALIINKMSRYAALGLAVFLLVTALAVHLPGLISAADDSSMAMYMSGFLKDLSLAGAALFISGHVKN